MPASLPVKQLDQRSSAVQKHKDLPAGRIPTQLITNQARQPVKAFAHIARPAIQMVAVRRVQAEHQPRVISRVITDRSHGSMQIFTPLGQLVSTRQAGWALPSSLTKPPGVGCCAPRLYFAIQ